MGKIQQNQSGFSVIEGLLILVIVAILGFTGLYVWQAKQNADKSLTSNSSTTPVIKKSGSTNNRTQTFSDSKAGLSFDYPASITGKFMVAEFAQDSEVYMGNGSPVSLKYDAPTDKWSTFTNSTPADNGYVVVDAKIDGKTIIEWGHHLVFAHGTKLYVIYFPETNAEGDSSSSPVTPSIAEGIAKTISFGQQ